MPFGFPAHHRKTHFTFLEASVYKLVIFKKRKDKKKNKTHKTPGHNISACSQELAKVRAGWQRECRSQAGQGGNAVHVGLQRAQPCRAQGAGSFFLVLLWLALWGPQMAICPSITSSILVFLFAM